MWWCYSYTGWWYTYPSEKYELVSWDHDIPNWMESQIQAMFQTTKQYTMSSFLEPSESSDHFTLGSTRQAWHCGIPGHPLDSTTVTDDPLVC